MLQSLLADRFKLRARRETKELRIFLLTAAKGGIKLQPCKAGSCVVVQPGQPVPAPAAGQQALKRCGNNIVFLVWSRNQSPATSSAEHDDGKMPAAADDAGASISAVLAFVNRIWPTSILRFGPPAGTNSPCLRPFGIRQDCSRPRRVSRCA